MKVHGTATIDVIETPPDPDTGKPYLKMTFSDGVVVNITTNLAEMIGGVGGGVRQRDGETAGRREKH